MRAGLPALLALLLSGLAAPIGAEVFHSRESALRLAFPAADSVSVRDLVLGAEQSAEIAARSGATLESRLVTVYCGWNGGEREGWAFLDTHTVRTLPETLLLVLDPEGRIRATHLLAFHEPPEYRPGARWLGQFVGRGLDPELGIGRGIAGLGGSTLTARAVTASIRRLLAVWSVVIAPELPASPASAGLASGNSGTRAS
jgi:hypothetical protein